MKFDPTHTLGKLAQLKVEIEQLTEDVPWLDPVEIQILDVAARGIGVVAVRINARATKC
jgi:hypothetical protein